MIQNSNVINIPLKKIICSLILGSANPISLSEIKKILDMVSDEVKAELDDDNAITNDEKNAAAAEEESNIVIENECDSGKTYSSAEIREAMDELQASFANLDLGVEIVEISGGYRFQTSSDCGRWVRKMLNKGKPSRLTRSTVETLAIIAYKQPVARSEIESIRGVSAGHVIKSLMEMQLVRIVGRSDLPGRPFLFGTTPLFLEHFGLTSLKDLNSINSLNTVK